MLKACPAHGREPCNRRIGKLIRYGPCRKRLLSARALYTGLIHFPDPEDTGYRVIRGQTCFSGRMHKIL